MSIFGSSGKKHIVAIDPLSVVVAAVLLFALFLLFQVKSVVVLLFLAFILMTALHPWVDFMNKRLRMPRGLAIFISYISVITFFVLLCGLVIPPLGQELYQLVKTIDIPYFQDEIRAFSLDISQISQIADRVGSSVTILFEILTSTFNSVFTIMTILVFSIYLMIDRPYLHRKIAWFTKEKKYFDIAEKFLDDLEFQLGGWVRGQFLLMLIIGFVTYVGLRLLNIPYALPLALLAGILEIVPNLGPTVASIPAIILAYVSGGPVMAGVIALFYLVMQQLENNIIVPRIMKESADVNPLIAMVVIITGLSLGGVVGALISVPTYIVFRITYSTFRHDLF